MISPSGQSTPDVLSRVFVIESYVVFSSSVSSSLEDSDTNTRNQVRALGIPEYDNIDGCNDDGK